MTDAGPVSLFDPLAAMRDGWPRLKRAFTMLSRKLLRL